jgi:diguanylate cyclase (GGDEF)-like protein
MDKTDFIGLINKALNKTSPKPIPLDELSGVELLAATKINEEIKKAATFEEIARGSLDVMDRAEGFAEKVIRVISAMIRLNMLGQSVDDADMLCRNIVEIIATELEFDNCSIMLKDRNSEWLELVAGCGKGDRYSRTSHWKTGAKIRTGEGVAGKAFAEGRAVFVSDITGDEAFKVFDSRVNMKSLLCLPITSGDERLGVINFSHPQQGNIYDTDMEKVMALLAGFVGQMIALSKFYTEMIQWNETLKDEVQKKTVELTKKNRRLRKLALIDPLTGIFNRRYFFKRLEEEFLRTKRYGEKYSLLFIDIDNLKPINDLQGHVTGDRVIKLLASCMKEIGRKGDVASRIGGDEFAYMLLASDAEGAYLFAQRLQEKFTRHNLRGLRYNTTISIGIANTDGDKFRDHKDLYEAADKALHEAKLIKNTIRIYTKRRNALKGQLPLIH